MLEGIYVFKVSRLVDALGVRIPESAKQHERGSYICLHRVPAHAILEEKAGSDVKYCELPSSIGIIANLLQSGIMVVSIGILVLGTIATIRRCRTISTMI